MNLVMSFETNERIDEIERLLSRCCARKYEASFKLLRAEHGGSRKAVRIRFDASSDRERFRNALEAAIGKRVSAPRPVPRSMLQLLFGR
jgi:hypothetical protein